MAGKMVFFLNNPASGQSSPCDARAFSLKKVVRPARTIVVLVWILQVSSSRIA
jgi:hypothetical protein